MSKYRTLTSEELALLEKEFVEFLVVNGISANDWQKIKAEEPATTHTFIELFSDVVFEKLMRKTQYLTKRMGEMLACFYYGEQSASLLLVEGWNWDIPLNEILEKDLIKEHYKISSQTKGYQKTRETELFQMIQGGAEVADGKLFKWLEKLEGQE